jgi:hypothetical protein
MDCFAEPVIRRRFAPTGWLAMTAGQSYAFSRRDAPEACWKFALEHQRAQGMPGAG